MIRLFSEIINSWIGWFHFITALIAMLAGLVVVFNTKGTKFHKVIGYIYVICMLSLNLSSFFLVNFGGFSIFHFFSIVSLISILGAMVPAWRRINNWLIFHYYFMSWSAVGLYCAFWAELDTRFVGNMQQFWWMVALATFITATIGSIIINIQVKKLKLK